MMPRSPPIEPVHQSVSEPYAMHWLIHDARHHLLQSHPNMQAVALQAWARQAWRLGGLTKDGDNKAEDDAEPGRPEVDAAGSWLPHDEVNERGLRHATRITPHLAQALHASSKMQHTIFSRTIILMQTPICEQSMASMVASKGQACGNSTEEHAHHPESRGSKCEGADESPAHGYALNQDSCKQAKSRPTAVLNAQFHSNKGHGLDRDGGDGTHRRSPKNGRVLRAWQGKSSQHHGKNGIWRACSQAHRYAGSVVPLISGVCVLTCRRMPQ